MLCINPTDRLYLAGKWTWVDPSHCWVWYLGTWTH